MKKIFGFSLVALATVYFLCFVFLACFDPPTTSSSPTTTTTVAYETVDLYNFKNYYSYQEGKYQCGFISSHMWLKWLTGSPSYPSLDNFISWMNNNGYGNLVINSPASVRDIREITNKSITNFVNSYSRITVGSYTSSYIEGYLKQIRKSISNYYQPLIFFCSRFNGYYNQKHAFIVCGYSRNRNYPNDEYKINRVIISNGENKNEYYRRVNKDEFASWYLDAYICDERVVKN